MCANVANAKCFTNIPHFKSLIITSLINCLYQGIFFVAATSQTICERAEEAYVFVFVV